jgi:hypothetical protein
MAEIADVLARRSGRSAAEQRSLEGASNAEIVRNAAVDESNEAALSGPGAGQTGASTAV